MALLAAGCGGVSDEAKNALADPPLVDTLDATIEVAPPTDGAPLPLEETSVVDAAFVDTRVADGSGPTVPSNDTCAGALSLVAEAKYKEVRGDTTVAGDDTGAHSCNAGAGRDVMFRIEHPGGDLALDTLGSSYDTVLALRRTCESGEIACSYRTTLNPGSSRIIYRGLEKGTYFVILDASGGGVGGAYRLGFAAVPFPRELGCDGPPLVISDHDAAGTPFAAGADVYDRVTTATSSKLSLRTGASGKDLCPTATGQMAFGQGAEQVYKLELKATRTLRTKARAIEPNAFSSGGSPRFDIFTYLRKGDGPPAAEPVANCRQSSSETSDICLKFGAELVVPKGTYWLVVDSLTGSQGRFHLHIDVEG